MSELKYREAARLYAAGHSLTEIAAMTGRSVRAVSKSLSHAKKRGIRAAARGAIRKGLISDVFISMPPAAVAWLRTQTPEGCTLAHTIAGIVQDVWAAETEAQ